MTAHRLHTEEWEGAPTWCPEQQIYLNGVVPTTNSEEVQRMVDENDGYLRIFGYGSLCWNPGSGTLAAQGVVTKPGRARGYKRCWAQKSADHRGTAQFPGIVCTLLSDEEVLQASGDSRQEERPTMTEGLIYTVPPSLVEDCLAELDFREKGGYARDVIDVVEDESGRSVKALLYRGTPDNPAFWRRALLDLPFASAIMSVSHGPSGPNDEYLFHLDHFMQLAAKSSPAASKALKDHTGDTDTGDLAKMTHAFQQYNLHFLFGAGSNQHKQLLLEPKHLVNGEDAHELFEMVLVTPKEESLQRPFALYAGGGHSGLLTDDGSLYLWGWNDHCQLGVKELETVSFGSSEVPLVSKLRTVDVQQASLGFSHTLVIEKETGRLFAFGDNGRGQVDGCTRSSSISEPITPACAQGDSIVDISAGLFHSAAISKSGELITFGCGRFGQCLTKNDGVARHDVFVGRWKPDDGSRLVQVACGRRHTVVLDEHGRVWTLGENKHGQLGRIASEGGNFDGTPHLVNGFLGQEGSRCHRIVSGWSHTLALTRSNDDLSIVYGWGRNDKGQLGTGDRANVSSPHQLFERYSIEKVAAGSESTVVVNIDGGIWGCGWNEHGNLSTCNDQDVIDLARVVGARIVAPPPLNGGPTATIIAAGGAHLLAMKVS